MKLFSALLLLTISCLLQADPQWENTTNDVVFRASVQADNAIFFIQMGRDTCSDADFAIIMPENRAIPNFSPNEKIQSVFMLLGVKEKQDGETSLKTGSLNGLTTHYQKKGFLVSLLEENDGAPFTGYNDYVRAIADSDYFFLKMTNRNGEGVAYRFPGKNFENAYDGMIEDCVAQRRSGGRLKKIDELQLDGR